MRASERLDGASGSTIISLLRSVQIEKEKACWQLATNRSECRREPFCAGRRRDARANQCLAYKRTRGNLAQAFSTPRSGTASLITASLQRQTWSTSYQQALLIIPISGRKVNWATLVLQ